MYDIDRDKKISKDELKRVLVATLEQNGSPLKSTQVDALVDSSFAGADQNKDGYIDYVEYRSWISKKPSMMDFFTVNVQGEIARVKRLSVAK